MGNAEMTRDRNGVSDENQCLENVEREMRVVEKEDNGECGVWKMRGVWKEKQTL